MRKDKKMKLVYSYYVLDIVHKGHLEMMKNSKAIASEDGKLIVGILTDGAVMKKNKTNTFIRRKNRTRPCDKICGSCGRAGYLFSTTKCNED